MRAFALLMLVFLPATQDPSVEHAKRQGVISRYFWEERLSLADYCKRNGLYRESKNLLEFMVKHIPGRHPYKSKAINKLKGAWTKRDNKPKKGKREIYLQKLEDYYLKCANMCYDLHRWCENKKMAAESKEALDHCTRYYVDHEKARRVRGEEKVEGFGWVPKDDAQMIRDTIVELEGADIDALAQKDGEHNTWKTSWVVKSKRYVIRSDVGIKKIAGALKALEGLYDALDEFLGDDWKGPEGPLGIYYFSRSTDLAKIRRDLPGVPDNAPAFFHGMTNLVYLVSWDGKQSELGRGATEFLLHEATHQWVDMAAEEKIWSIYQSAQSRGDAIENYWIVEGFACYAATLKFVDGKPVMGQEAWRMGSVKKSIAQGSIRRLDAMMMMDYNTFLKESWVNYSHAYAFCHYLIHADDGKHAEAFKKFLKEFYLGSGRVKNFEKIFKTNGRDLEGPFRDHVNGK